MERLKITGKADDHEEMDEGPAGDGEKDESKQPEKKVKEKNKMRGKNKSLKRYLRKKKKNVIDPATVRLALSYVNHVESSASDIACHSG